MMGVFATNSDESKRRKIIYNIKVLESTTFTRSSGQRFFLTRVLDNYRSTPLTLSS